MEWHRLRLHLSQLATRVRARGCPSSLRGGLRQERPKAPGRLPIPLNPFGVQVVNPALPSSLPPRGLDTGTRLDNAILVCTTRSSAASRAPTSSGGSRGVEKKTAPAASSGAVPPRSPSVHSDQARPARRRALRRVDARARCLSPECPSIDRPSGKSEGANCRTPLQRRGPTKFLPQ
jgi:hypothetical protein